MCSCCGEHKDCDKNLAKTSAPHKKEKGNASDFLQIYECSFEMSDATFECGKLLPKEKCTF